jgi:hypothetical protein
MGFLYLLIPLNWVNALMLETSPHRWPLLALIGVCGAIVLSTEFRQRYQAPTLPELGYIAMSAALWFISGSGPGLLLSPLHVGLIGGGVIALTIGLILLPIKSTGQGFEQAALRIVIPVFVLYLAMSVLWPPLRPLGSWHGMLGLRYTDRLLPRINYLMAFTVFGYLLAEWRGWAGVGWQRDLPRVLGIAIAASFTLEFLAGFQIGNGASLLRSATVIAGALFGSVLYHLSWAHIQYLLRRTQ